MENLSCGVTVQHIFRTKKMQIKKITLAIVFKVSKTIMDYNN